MQDILFFISLNNLLNILFENKRLILKTNKKNLKKVNK